MKLKIAQIKEKVVPILKGAEVTRSSIFGFYVRACVIESWMSRFAFYDKRPTNFSFRYEKYAYTRLFSSRS
ncbi:hypothetical protein HYT74_01660 [Candidatus Daviesbacteria bacterium]|nr:hypothetical protein [Candidatus Daviesbacteria bacterium]